MSYEASPPGLSGSKSHDDIDTDDGHMRTLETEYSGPEPIEPDHGQIVAERLQADVRSGLILAYSLTGGTI